MYLLISAKLLPSPCCIKSGLKLISAEKCLLLAHVDANGICPACSVRRAGPEQEQLRAGVKDKKDNKNHVNPVNPCLSN